MNKHIKMMMIAYKEALKVKGLTSPNPAVGAVIVKDDKILSKGATGKPGEPHAEIHALNKCGDDARGATMYVTLEPCCIHGRTPPCTDAIIKAGIKEVYIGTADPNPRINCNGISILKEKGIKVVTGFCQEKLIALNEDFFKYITTGMPFVLVKYAQTLNGFIAADSGDSKWISSKKSRKYVHKLRGIYDSILVGAGTVAADDPELTVRTNKLPNPIRIILDPLGISPYESKVMSDENKTIFIVNKSTPKTFLSQIEKNNNKEFIMCKTNGNEVDLQQMLKNLAKEEITSVLVEGGQKVLTSFFENDLVDKINVFICPNILPSGITPLSGINTQKISDGIKIKVFNQRKISDDVMISGYIHTPDEYLNL